MKTKIVIEIDTEFKDVTIETEGFEEENVTPDAEKEFHEQIFKYVEDQITDDEMPGLILCDYWPYNGDYCPEDAKQFSDLGKVSIKIYEEKVQTQKDN